MAKKAKKKKAPGKRLPGGKREIIAPPPIAFGQRKDGKGAKPGDFVKGVFLEEFTNDSGEFGPSKAFRILCMSAKGKDAKQFKGEEVTVWAKGVLEKQFESVEIGETVTVQADGKRGRMFVYRVWAEPTSSKILAGLTLKERGADPY